MKKLFMLFAAAAMTISASAQKTAITGNKFGDNWYVGINAGATAPTLNHSWMGDVTPNVGIRVGKNLTTVFGVAAEGNIYGYSACDKIDGKCAVDYLNVNLLGTFNLSNLICGYNGTPRAFEVTAIYGLGWGHYFGAEPKADTRQQHFNNGETVLYGSYVNNSITSKVAIDFAYNFGSDKQFQLYLEPSLNYGLYAFESENRWEINAKPMKAQGNPVAAVAGHDCLQYNLAKSNFQVNLGFVYKFMTSNGTHNFAKVALRDQAEIDALNAEIAALKARKPETITKEVIKYVDVPVAADITNNLVFVTFAQGKSVLTNEAKAALDGVAKGSHVQIVGTASPEGPADLNQRLSQARADVVADYLKANGVVVDEATGKGVQGTTSNRLAIVYVK